MIIDNGYALYQNLGDLILTNSLFTSNLLWAMEGGKNLRRQDYYAYKQNRTTTNHGLYVEQLRTHINFYYPYVVKSVGYEADDLIACYITITENLDVVGIDKDLLQIPNIKLSYIDKNQQVALKSITPNMVGKRLLHYIGDNISPYQWLLFQILNGDKSDNIPRIIEKHSNGLNTIVTLLESQSPFSSAYELIGENFVTNLKLILLPHYSMLELSVENIIELLDYFYNSMPNTYWCLPEYIKPTFSDYLLESLDRFNKKNIIKTKGFYDLLKLIDKPLVSLLSSY